MASTLSHRSGDPRADGWFGQGWSHSLCCELWLQVQQLRYHDPQGRGINLPVLDIGQRRWIAYEQFEVHRIDERRWDLHHKDGRSLLFEQLHPGQWRLTLTELRDRTGQRVQLHYSTDKAHNAWGPSPAHTPSPTPAPCPAPFQAKCKRWASCTTAASTCTKSA